MTALHYASLAGSEATVKVLVKRNSELTMLTNVSSFQGNIFNF